MLAEESRMRSGACWGIFTIILLPPFLAVAILSAGYAGYLPFDVSIHTLVTLVIIFFVFIFFIKHNASYAACVISNNFLKMEEALQGALKRNALEIMGKTKSTLTVRDFIEEYFKDIRDDNYARVAATVFPMLGILGTFVAIAISMPDFTVSSSSKLDREISLLLSGIGTAFYASIYGIFLSLWWIFFERRGVGRIEKNIIALERLYGNRIWKKSELIKHEHMQSEIRDEKIMQTLKETFNLDFIKDLNEQYMRNYRQIIEDTGNSFSVMARNMKKASDDLRETLSMLEEKRSAMNAQKAIDEKLQSFIESTRSMQKGLDHFNGSVDRTFMLIDKELARAIEQLGRMAQTIAEEGQKLRKFDQESNKDSGEG